MRVSALDRVLTGREDSELSSLLLDVSIRSFFSFSFNFRFFTLERGLLARFIRDRALKAVSRSFAERRATAYSAAGAVIIGFIAFLTISR
jgi:hypothetical protein